jgi:translation initiation factor IF-2
LKALETDEVAVKAIGSGVGLVNENDVQLAHGSNAVIYAFNASVPTNVKRLANRDKVVIHEYKIIYELIDDIRAELSQMLSPEIIETDLGKLRVKAIFKTTKSEVICGGEVIAGKLAVPAQAKITRAKKQIAEVEVTNLKRGPQDVKEVEKGEMCGISLKTEKKINLLEGDILGLFKRESIERKL